MVANLNDAGLLDVDDILIVLDGWGPCEDFVADIDNVRDVGLIVLLALLDHWDP